MKTLIKLEILRILRNRKFLFFTIAYPIVLYVAISRTGNREELGGLDMSLYFMVSMAGFGAVGATLMTTSQRISQERAKGWVRQLKLTALHENGYVLAKIIAAATATAPSIALVLVAGRVFNGVDLAVWQWLAVFFATWLGSFVFAALGVALGYLAAPETVQPIVMIVYMGSSLLGGLWMPIEAFPHWLQNIGEVLPTYRFTALGKAIETGHAPYLADMAWLAGYLVLFVAAGGWLYRRDKERS